MAKLRRFEDFPFIKSQRRSDSDDRDKRGKQRLMKWSSSIRLGHVCRGTMAGHDRRARLQSTIAEHDRGARSRLETASNSNYDFRFFKFKVLRCPFSHREGEALVTREEFRSRDLNRRRKAAKRHLTGEAAGRHLRMTSVAECTFRVGESSRSERSDSACGRSSTDWTGFQVFMEFLPFQPFFA